MDVSNRANLDEIFADANQITAYAREALSWAVADGYMKGSTSNGATKVYPKDGATRAEVATLLMRYLKAEKDRRFRIKQKKKHPNRPGF